MSALLLSYLSNYPILGSVHSFIVCMYLQYVCNYVIEVGAGLKEECVCLNSVFWFGFRVSVLGMGWDGMG